MTTTNGLNLWLPFNEKPGIIWSWIQNQCIIRKLDRIIIIKMVLFIEKFI